MSLKTNEGSGLQISFLAVRMSVGVDCNRDLNSESVVDCEAKNKT